MGLSLAEVLGLLLVSGPDAIELRSTWLLHEALRRADGDERLAEILPEIELRQTPDIGFEVEGVGDLLHDLADLGVLRVQFDPVAGTLLMVNRNRLRPYLRLMMRLDPAIADVFYFVGTSWRARASTAEKMFESPRESAAPIVASGIPKRFHPPPALAR